LASYAGDEGCFVFSIFTQNLLKNTLNFDFWQLIGIIEK